MPFNTILLEYRDRVGLLTLNRPEKFNTFSTELAEELNAALLQAEEEEQVGVVVVKGAGKAFSTGIDIVEFPGKSEEDYKRWVSLMDKMYSTIASMGKPVIAMVNGHAVANGAGLMAAADFVIAAEGVKIGTTAINVGLLCTGPIIPMTYSLGKHKVLEMLLLGEMIDAKEAERIGLVNKVVPADKIEEETWNFANKLLAKSPVALRLGKQFYYKMKDLPFEEKLRLHWEMFSRLCTTEDAREGVNAFLEKRKPMWKGR